HAFTIEFPDGLTPTLTKDSDGDRAWAIAILAIFSPGPDATGTLSAIFEIPDSATDPTEWFDLTLIGVVIAAVPEPPTLMLIAIPLGLVAWRRRRRGLRS